MARVRPTDKYTYRVIWSDEDEEFVGLCAEFPSLSWLHERQELALAGIAKLVRRVVADMEANGESLPLSLAAQKYSGVFKVRIPPVVHRNLVIEAAEAGVSLNRLVSARLAHG